MPNVTTLQNELQTATAQMNVLELEISPITRVFVAMGETAAAAHPEYPAYLEMLAQWDAMKVNRDAIKTAIFKAKQEA